MDIATWRILLLGLNNFPNVICFISVKLKILILFFVIFLHYIILITDLTEYIIFTIFVFTGEKQRVFVPDKSICHAYIPVNAATNTWSNSN